MSYNEIALTPQDFYDLFGEIDSIEPFDIKKEELAAQLTALMSYSNTTRSDFSKKSGWQKSTVTAVLNGKRNPTFKTLWEFASHLGYEADLIFRRPNEPPAHQPWNSKEYQTITILSVENKQFYVSFNSREMPEVFKNIQIEISKTPSTQTKFIWQNETIKS